MFRLRRICRYIVIVIVFILIACQEDNSIEIIYDPCFATFSVKDKSGNFNHPCLIENDTIRVVFSEIDSSFCVPVFNGDFDYVLVDGEKVLSGESVIDFNEIKVFECVKLTASEHLIHKYVAIIKTLNGLPRIDIHTDNNTPIESREETVKAFISISNDPEFGYKEGGGKNTRKR